MPPKGGKKKYSNVTALPGGSELEALAWGYHTAKGVRGDRIAGLVNNSTEELLSGTGRAEWGVLIPDLGVQLPASRQTIIDSVGSEQLAAAFAGSVRRKNAYDPLNVYHQDQALKALSGASDSRSAYGRGSTTFPDGSILTKAKSYREAPAYPSPSETPAARQRRSTRARARAATAEPEEEEPLTIEDMPTLTDAELQEILGN